MSTPNLEGRSRLLTCLLFMGSMLAGCGGLGTIQGRVHLPISSQTGRPSLSPDQICKLVRVEVGTLETFTCTVGGFPMTSQRFKTVLAPSRFESSVYDEKTGTCTYSTQWPVGSYHVSAYYITDGESAFNVPGLAGSTWEPAMAAGETIAASALQPVVLEKDKTIQKDLHLARARTMSRPSLFNRDCK